MNCRVGCIPPPSLLRFMKRLAMAAAAAVKAMSITGMTLVASLSSNEMCEPPCWVNDADICGAMGCGVVRVVGGVRGERRAMRFCGVQCDAT